MLTTFLLGVAIIAAMGAAGFAWQATSPRRERRRIHRARIRDWRRDLRHLHSGHIDNLPGSGGPQGGDG